MKEIQNFIEKYGDKNSMLLGNGEISIASATGYEIKRLLEISAEEGVLVLFNDGRLRFSKRIKPQRR